MRQFFVQRWFLVALVAVLLAGIFWPTSIGPIVRLLPGDVIVAAVTFIMALPLETAAFWGAIRRPGPAWLASVINSGVAPPLGWLASQTVDPELRAGVILAATVPCTLATAAVWTRRAGGNDAIAFLVTMITNLACFLVVPAWLWLLIGVRANVDFKHIVLGLILVVVLPIIAAQIIRQWPPIGSWATNHKHALSGVAQAGVLWIVAVGAVECGQRLVMTEGGAPVAVTDIVTMIIAVATVHGVLLSIGYGAARILNFNQRDAIAVAFSGSQKTLMVGAFLALAIGPLAILPMVAYHAAQLVIDTLVADRWRGQANRAADRQ
jgi:sodium/bile acid cotransporter 7